MQRLCCALLPRCQLQRACVNGGQALPTDLMENHLLSQGPKAAVFLASFVSPTKKRLVRLAPLFGGGAGGGVVLTRTPPNGVLGRRLLSSIKEEETTSTPERSARLPPSSPQTKTQFLLRSLLQTPTVPFIPHNPELLQDGHRRETCTVSSPSFLRRPKFYPPTTPTIAARDRAIFSARTARPVAPRKEL
jgi:hypothetical protein